MVFYFENYFSMKYVRLIFGGNLVLNYKRHLTYFQFLIHRKIIESSSEDLNHTHVTELAQRTSKKIGWMKKNSLSIVKVFSIHCLDFEHWHVAGLTSKVLRPLFWLF